MAAKAKELKKQQSILFMPISKVGKTLSTETVDKVIQFYESDINSRIMPNKKDCVTIKKDGKKQKIQKCLLMYDVCALHTKFKELYPEYPIGLTKFVDQNGAYLLELKECILFAFAQFMRILITCLKLQCKRTY